MDHKQKMKNNSYCSKHIEKLMCWYLPHARSKASIRTTPILVDCVGVKLFVGLTRMFLILCADVAIVLQYIIDLIRRKHFI